MIRNGQLVDTAYADFKVTVLPVVKSVSPTDSSLRPQWELKLKDHLISVEENLIYYVDIKETLPGMKRKISYDLGSAFEFLFWDDTTESFKVHEGAALEEYIGQHEVSMEVSFFNSTYYETYEDTFTITVVAREEETWVPPQIRPPAPEPEVPFLFSEQGLEPGPYNPDQPIPYIADLSVTGVLTIGWDRGMTARVDFEKINPSRVAIRDENDVKEAQEKVVETG